MTSLLKVAGAFVLGAVIGLLAHSSGVTFGGVYHTVIQDFSEGISVDGITVIDGSRNVSAGTISGSTGTFSGAVSGLYPVQTLTSDTTVTVAQAGTTFYVGTAGVDVTLPAASTAAGVRYRMMISAAFASTNVTVVTSGSENAIEGTLIVAGAVVDCRGEDTLSFVNDGEQLGDYVELSSNGTNWFLRGEALTASKLTCTQAS